MLVCPYCEWPFASQNELNTHIEIRHNQEDDLLDDGVYIDDDVIHAPYDNDDFEDYDYTEGDIGQDGEI